MNEEKIANWTKFKNDYLALQARLKTMPDELNYEVMVKNNFIEVTICSRSIVYEIFNLGADFENGLYAWQADSYKRDTCSFR